MQVETIYGGDYSAKIDVNHGANCISLRNEKYKAKILREPDHSSVSDNPFLYGMPILYPVNRIQDGKFVFEGRNYEFPVNEFQTNCHLHGELCKTPFEIKKKRNDYIVCSYCVNQPYMNYPHKFFLEISYRLNTFGLLIKTKIMNLSTKNMPNFLGFHTTFNIPFLSGSTLDEIRIFADISEEIERDAERHIPTGKILERDTVFESLMRGVWKPSEGLISRHYRAGQSGLIRIIDTKKKLSVVYENDKKLGWRLFFNGGANDFICLEPQTCMVNCQNAPFDRNYSGFDFIPPQKSKTYVSKIYIREE